MKSQDSNDISVVFIDWSETEAAVDGSGILIEPYVFNTKDEADAFVKGFYEGCGWLSEPDYTIFTGTEDECKKELDRLDEEAKLQQTA